MNLKKLTTLLFAGVTAATPFATNAQNPTILQGNYISNVFGQANFVLNPNAQTNVANVTLTNATATRSTTTPLVATSEWNVTVTSANGTATWATRSFDAGMKNQNCEARFSYRGFQATSKAQIKQGANVVAELTLTPSATDPRIASINFPCGDLSSATTFVITDSATLSGTNEIGGIYVGLATNQANVAQAEAIVKASRSTTQSINNATKTTVIYNIESMDVYGEYESSTGVFTAKRSGKYLVQGILTYDLYSWAAGNIAMISVQKNGTDIVESYYTIDSNASSRRSNQINQMVELNVGETLNIATYQTRGSASNLIGSSIYNNLSIYRFPSSSELVVTPETQNVWGSAFWTAAKNFSTASTTLAAFSDPVFAVNRTFYGKAESLTNPNDVGLKIPQMPAGNYKIQLSARRIGTQNGHAGTVDFACTFSLQDGTNNWIINTNDYGPLYTSNSTHTGTFVVSYNTVADREYKLYYSAGYARNTNCSMFEPRITITPLDNASNSALYVQGPVKASETGTAIPSGYVFEQTSSNHNFTITNNAAAVQNITSFTLNPGVWMVEATCIFRSNTTTATTSWNFASALIADANNSTAGTDEMSYSAAYLGHINVGSQYYPIFIKRYINVTSATTYYLNTRNIYGANNPTVGCNLKRTRLN